MATPDSSSPLKFFSSPENPLSPPAAHPEAAQEIGRLEQLPSGKTAKKDFKKLMGSQKKASKTEKGEAKQSIYETKKEEKEEVSVGKVPEKEKTAEEGGLSAEEESLQVAKKMPPALAQHLATIATPEEVKKPQSPRQQNIPLYTEAEEETGPGEKVASPKKAPEAPKEVISQKAQFTTHGQKTAFRDAGGTGVKTPSAEGKAEQTLKGHETARQRVGRTTAGLPSQGVAGPQKTQQSAQGQAGPQDTQAAASKGEVAQTHKGEGSGAVKQSQDVQTQRPETTGVRQDQDISPSTAGRQQADIPRGDTAATVGESRSATRGPSDTAGLAAAQEGPAAGTQRGQEGLSSSRGAAAPQEGARAADTPLASGRDEGATIARAPTPRDAGQQREVVHPESRGGDVPRAREGRADVQITTPTHAQGRDAGQRGDIVQQRGDTAPPPLAKGKDSPAVSPQRSAETGQPRQRSVADTGQRASGKGRADSTRAARQSTPQQQGPTASARRSDAPQAARDGARPTTPQETRAATRRDVPPPSAPPPKRGETSALKKAPPEGRTALKALQTLPNPEKGKKPVWSLKISLKAQPREKSTAPMGSCSLSRDKKA